MTLNVVPKAAWDPEDSSESRLYNMYSTLKNKPLREKENRKPKNLKTICAYTESTYCILLAFNQNYSSGDPHPLSLQIKTTLWSDETPKLVGLTMQYIFPLPRP